MHGYLAGIDTSDASASVWARAAPARSYGQSFLAVLGLRFTAVGVYLMDEPEAALSFSSCLGPVPPLHQMRREEAR